MRESSWEDRLRARSGEAAAIVVWLGALVLIGWSLDVSTLKSIFPRLVAMNPLTATAFILAGFSLLLSQTPSNQDRTGWRRSVALVAAAFVMLIGAVTLAGYFAGRNFGLDQLIFHAKLNGNRIAPNTGLNFLLAGLALVLLDIETQRGSRPAQLCGLITGLIALLVITGYVYGSRSLYGVASYIPMAVNTASAFAVLSIGILCARPNRGFMALVISDSPGGAIARRLLPAVPATLLIVGSLAQAGHRTGIYDAAFGLSLFVVVSIVIFGGLIWTHARSLDHADEARREAESASRQAREDAERANAAKSEFLSRMSHELRTPLNAILGFGQLMETDSLKDEHRESVHHILKAGRHLLDLINEVLDIARIEAGRLSLSTEPLALKAVVKDVLDLTAPLAKHRQIRVTADGVLDGEEVYVVVDLQRLKQVLLNLLSNAVKYNREGGEIILSSTKKLGNRLRLQVRDTGPGIPREKMAQIFKPFARLDAEQSTIEGTGLGLALSKHLVEAMGGSIGVESVLDEGSTFWIELRTAERPAEAAEVREAIAALPETSYPAPVTLLYIEDNTSNLKLVERLLARRPQVTLITAMQGRLGLELAARHRPDLILLDVHLPDLSGDEVLRRLREAAETRAIPVVIVSADATAAPKERLLSAGAHAYLTKPLDITKFLAVLDEVFGKPKKPAGSISPSPSPDPALTPSPTPSASLALPPGPAPTPSASIALPGPAPTAAPSSPSPDPAPPPSSSPETAGQGHPATGKPSQ